MSEPTVVVVGAADSAPASEPTVTEAQAEAIAEAAATEAAGQTAAPIVEAQVVTLELILAAIQPMSERLERIEAHLPTLATAEQLAGVSTLLLEIAEEETEPDGDDVVLDVEPATEPEAETQPNLDNRSWGRKFLGV